MWSKITRETTDWNIAVKKAGSGDLLPRFQLLSSVLLVETRKILVPQFLHLCCGDHKSTYFIGYCKN